MSGQPEVLFVSKPIAPPFHDGAKCLVRDVASHLVKVRPIVLTTVRAPALPGVKMERIYPASGSFAPTLQENARVLARLILGRSANIWHFVFAPNPRSSSAARLARRIRRTPTVQTVASAPRSFANVSGLLFGDRVVTLSQWTRDKLVENGADARIISVIPPGVAHVTTPAASVLGATRASLGIGVEQEIVLYPGDIEQSTGADMVARAVPHILAERAQAVVVFACRKKTARAEAAEARLRGELARHGDRVRFVGEVPDLVALLATSSLVVFPVDDLYGKINLPMALLEAMALGLPMVVLDHGPLSELGAGAKVAPGDVESLARTSVALLGDPSRRGELGQKARDVAKTRYRPENAASAYEALYEDLL